MWRIHQNKSPGRVDIEPDDPTSITKRFKIVLPIVLRTTSYLGTAPAPRPLPHSLLLAHSTLYILIRSLFSDCARARGTNSG